MRIELSFPRSRSPLFVEAVRLARELPSYHATDDGAFHHLTFTANRADLVALLRLWDLVAPWRGSRLVIDGTPVGPGLIHFIPEILSCAVRATLFDPPARYCTSGPAPEPALAAAIPQLPCRWFMARGAWDLGRIDWRGSGRFDALRALLVESGITLCPFFDLEAVVSELATWQAAPSGDAARQVDRLLRDVLSDHRRREG